MNICKRLQVLSVADQIVLRDIKSAVHFTTLDNLYLILEAGFIKPRCEVDETALLNIRNEAELIKTPDMKRYDGRTDCVNLSVSEPNYWLLRQYIERTGIHDSEWVVLYLKPSLFENDSCVFCASNAASSVCCKQIGPKGFDALFSSRVDTKRGPIFRNENKPPYCTTDQQAEVLVPGKISTTEIQKIVVTDADTKSTLNACMGYLTDLEIRIEVDAHLLTKFNPKSG